MTLPAKTRLLASPRIATFSDGSSLILGSTLDRHAHRPVPIVRVAKEGAVERIATIGREDALRPGTDPGSGVTLLLPLPVHGGDLWPVLPNEAGIAVLRKPIPGDGQLARASLALLDLAGDTIRQLRFFGRARPAPSEAYNRERDRSVAAAMRGRPFTEKQVRRAVNTR